MKEELSMFRDRTRSKLSSEAIFQPRRSERALRSLTIISLISLGGCSIIGEDQPESSANRGTTIEAFASPTQASRTTTTKRLLLPSTLPTQAPTTTEAGTATSGQSEEVATTEVRKSTTTTTASSSTTEEARATSPAPTETVRPTMTLSPITTASTATTTTTTIAPATTRAPQECPIDLRNIRGEGSEADSILVDGGSATIRHDQDSVVLAPGLHDLKDYTDPLAQQYNQGNGGTYVNWVNSMTLDDSTVVTLYFDGLGIGPSKSYSCPTPA